jgi:hypothetical protein
LTLLDALLQAGEKGLWIGSLYRIHGEIQGGFEASRFIEERLQCLARLVVLFVHQFSCVPRGNIG